MPPFTPGHPKVGGKVKGSRHRKTLAREAGKARALKLAEVDAAWTMARIARIADSRIGDACDAHGNLLPLKDLPPTIASSKVLKTNVVSGDGQQEVTQEVKLWDKMAALTILAKHFGLVTDKQEIEVYGRLELVTAALNRIKDRNRAKSTEKP